MATIETRITDMIATLTEALNDANKHDKGNNAAGTRIRKAFQTCLLYTSDAADE